AETDRLRSEASERVAASEKHAASVMDQASRTRDESRDEAARLKDRAQQEAEQIVSAARQQADRMERHGQQEAERVLDLARKDAAAFHGRRDNILEQLSDLRDVIGSLGSEIAAPREEPNNGAGGAAAIEAAPAGSAMAEK
ncbi:MAG: hypothetical protein ACRDO7_03260, partial [Nocardioidaceae bacterium]